MSKATAMGPNLTGAAGEAELTARLEEAHAAEGEHVEKVRGWIAAGQTRPLTPRTALGRRVAGKPKYAAARRRTSGKRRAGRRRAA